MYRKRADMAETAPPVHVAIDSPADEEVNDLFGELPRDPSLMIGMAVVQVRNDHSAVITDVHISLRSSRGGGWTELGHNTVSALSPSEDAPRVVGGQREARLSDFIGVVEFTDDSGRRWERKSDGTSRRILKF
jgi:hypothetical protein